MQFYIKGIFKLLRVWSKSSRKYSKVSLATAQGLFVKSNQLYLTEQVHWLATMMKIMKQKFFVQNVKGSIYPMIKDIKK
jgi:hypothetical protein